MNQLPVQLNSHPWPVRNGYDSVLDRKIPLHRKAEIVLRDKILKPLAVPHGAGHMVVCISQFMPKLSAKWAILSVPVIPHFHETSALTRSVARLRMDWAAPQ